MVKQILRLEGLAIFLASIYFYNRIDASWILFILLFLVPDVSMVGYLKDKKMGSITYNLVHNYVSALVLVVFGFVGNVPLISALGFILTAHIGLDRLFEYGLKYPSNFKDTHIKKV